MSHAPRLVHEGGFRVETEADGAVRFRAPAGWLVPDAPRSRWWNAAGTLAS